MRTIDIDDDVYAYLAKQAIPFEESPNLTLRRLFGLKPIERLNIQELSTFLLHPDSSIKARAQKRRKTELGELVRGGLLSEGQEVHCQDFKGERLPDATATVLRSQLSYRGQTYSMSELARRLLVRSGFTSTAVRGPRHWRIDSGESIADLWERHVGDDGLTNLEREVPAGNRHETGLMAANKGEHDMRWLDWIVTALSNLGGNASYFNLYKEIARIRPGPLPDSWKAIIRRTIETHSSDSHNFTPGNDDLFFSVSGIGRGEWGLR